MTLKPPLPRANPLDSPVQTIVENRQYLTQGHVAALRALLPQETAENAPVSGQNVQDFDLKGEISAQIRFVRGLREAAMRPDGTLKGEVNEAKGVISASSQLLTLLMRFQERIDRDHRLREIEAAMLAAMEDTPEATRARFLEALEGKLGAIE